MVKFLLVLILLLPTLSHSTDTNPVSYWYKWQTANCPSCAFQDSNDDACQAGLTFQQSQFPASNFQFHSTNNNQCKYTTSSGGPYTHSMQQQQMCNGVLVTAGSCVDETCISPDIYDPLTNTCLPPPPECELTGKSPDIYFSTNGGSQTQCDGTCTIQAQIPSNLGHYMQTTGNCLTSSGNRIINGNNDTLSIGCWFPAEYTGDSCSTSDIASAPSSSTPSNTADCIASGGLPGTVNGSFTCQSGGGVQTTGTSADGSDGSTQDSGNGTTTGTNTTDNEAPNYQTGGGAVTGGTGTTNEPTPDLCAANPNIPACKDADSGIAANTTDLYNTNNDANTIKQAFLNNFAIIENSPIFSTATGFFALGSITGTCGGFSGSIPFYNTNYEVNLDNIFCSASSTTYYYWLGLGVLLVAGWVSFRWAFL